MNSNISHRLPASVLDAMRQYALLCNQSRFSMLRTALERYAVAGWGGPIASKKQRVSTEAQAFLETLPIAALGTAIEAVEKGCDQLGLNAQGRSKNRSYVKQFLAYCDQEGWLSTASLTQTTRKPLYRRRKNSKGNHKIYRVSSTGARLSAPSSLGTQAGDYIMTDAIGTNPEMCFTLWCLAVKGAAQVKGLSNFFVFTHVLGNPSLRQELENFAAYLGNVAIADGTLHKVLQMLGYLLRVQGIPLTELSLTKVVSFVRLTYTEEDFPTNSTFKPGEDGIPESPERIAYTLSVQHNLAQRRLKQETKQLLHWIDDYLDWLDQGRIDAGAKNGLADSTKQLQLDAFIRLAKYIYKAETHSRTFDDIALVKRLKEKRNALKVNRAKQKARVAARCIRWEQVIQVVELHREQADERYGLPQIKPNGRVYPIERQPIAIASELQKTIILLLMTLIPSDRQQTYRRLQLRESLKPDEVVEGVFLVCGEVTDKVFTPKKKLKKPDQACWWIALYSFKTIDTYDPFWYPVPNQPFKDGKRFYEYLEMWFFGLEAPEDKWPQYYKGEDAQWQGYIDANGKRHGWRAALQPNHDFAFSMPRNRTPFNIAAFTHLVSSTFVELTPKVDDGRITSVTPHSFRTMFATYTEGKVTSAEEASLAYCEHHARELRRNTYTLSNNLRKIAPAQQAMERINNELFLARSLAQQATRKSNDVELVTADTSEAPDLLPKSVFDAMQCYAQVCNPNRFSMLRTTIERFAVVGWQGPKPKAGRKVAIAAQAFLKTLPIEQLRDVLEAVERGCHDLKLSPQGRSKNRSYANKFLEYCKEQGWLPEVTANVIPLEKGQPGEYRFRQVGEQRICTFSSTSAGKVNHQTLGKHPDDYITVAGQQVLGSAGLHQDLKDFAAYISHLKTGQLCIYRVQQMLGYLHHVEGVPLAELRLAKLVPFVKLNYTEGDFADNPAFALNSNGTAKAPIAMESELAAIESLARQQLRQAAKKLCRWIDQYFDWFDQSREAVGATGGTTSGTKVVYIQTLIKVAQYLYRAETGSVDFADIEIINRLRDKAFEFPCNRRERKARVGASCITWEEVIEVVELQRKQADTRHTLAFFSPYTKDFYAPKRRVNAIAHDIQKVLILLLLTLIPSDRQQSFRRLQFRESLRVKEQTEGAFILCGELTNDVLVPRDQMKHPEQAQWWLALYEFKTIEKYGAFWYPLPNQLFQDGKTFYEYLEMWFFGLEDTEGKWAQYYKKKNAQWQGYIDKQGVRHGWRAALKPGHDYVFSTSQSCQPFTIPGFTQLVRSIFIRFTQELERGVVVPVTPQRFRTMFATYTAAKLTPAEEESIAYCEHHSVPTRRTVYTLHDNMKQIAPARQAMDRINNSLFLGGKMQG